MSMHRPMEAEKNKITAETNIKTNSPYNSCQRVLVVGLNLNVFIASPNFGTCSRSMSIDARPVMIMVLSETCSWAPKNSKIWAHSRWPIVFTRYPSEVYFCVIVLNIQSRKCTRWSFTKKRDKYGICALFSHTQLGHVILPRFSINWWVLWIERSWQY